MNFFALSPSAANNRRRVRRGTIAGFHFTLFLSLLLTILFWQLAALELTAALVGAQQQRTSSITGRVVSDSGQPLVNVLIRVRGVSSNNSATRTTSTDEDGKFSVSDLDSGAYTVTATTPGYVLTRDDNRQEVATIYRRPGDSVTLTMSKGGVVTGKVTNKAGDPVVGIGVRAIRLRDDEKRPVNTSYFGGGQGTDDRGIYRLYGLEPGTYVIVASGGESYYSYQGAYDNEAPTYHPSATRDTAAEVVVRSGSETSGIDIRYRGDQGRTVSGTLAGAVESSSNRYDGINLSLTNAASGTVEAYTFSSGRSGERGFAFNGVPDGEYDLTARRGFGNEAGAASTPRRIVVRGADVTGLEITLAPLGSFSGRVRIEPLSDADRQTEVCKDQRSSVAAFEELVIIARRKEVAEDKTVPRPSAFVEDETPNNRGDFTLRNLEAGNYRIEVRLPAKHLYVRAITFSTPPAPATSGRAASARRGKDVAKDEFALQPGERVGNVVITIAEGAARLKGRVVGAAETVPLPARLRLHLVPVEAEYAEQAWRYADTIVERDGNWTLSAVAPGAYRIFARAAEAELTERDSRRPLAADAAGRARLRREAETVNTQIKLGTCQQLADYVIRYAVAVEQ